MSVCSCGSAAGQPPGSMPSSARTMSLAWAMVEHLHEGVRPKTLFATHYHELTELASVLEAVTNLTLAV